MSTDITNDITSDSATADTGHDAHDEHEVSDKQYVVIALLLAVLTALEVAATEVGLGSFLIPALLTMMAIKFFIVVSYFMHLKHDSALFKFSFYVGLTGALVLYSVMLMTFHFFID